MILKEFKEEELGHVSYLIADEESKECAIIDPKRDIDEYVNLINEYKLNLRYIINTHTHADYIGGDLELICKYPNAKNVFHKNVPKHFCFLGVKEGDVLYLGNMQLKIIETFGHTIYDISCIVNEDDVDKYIFTGDILFVGDVGRPDLLGQEFLNNLLNFSYETMQKLWDLDDSLIVLPSHIKGSLCGKNLKNNYFSTIGIEKKTNNSFILSQKDKKDYINYLKNQYIETPLFFKKMANINIKGPKLLKELKEPKKLKFKEFLEIYKDEDVILDFRHPNCFKANYIKDSINVYEYSNISLIIGSLIDNEKKLFLVGSRKTDFKNIIKKLRRIGFDNIEAILIDDVNEIEGLSRFEANSNLPVKIINLDFPKKIGDINLKVSEIVNYKFDKNYSYKAVCKNGYKAMAVESYLKKILY
jgi:hydroxyacylglutathione hydrolase